MQGDRKRVSDGTVGRADREWVGGGVVTGTTAGGKRKRRDKSKKREAAEVTPTTAGEKLAADKGGKVPAKEKLMLPAKAPCRGATCRASEAVWPVAAESVSPFGAENVKSSGATLMVVPSVNKAGSKLLSPLYAAETLSLPRGSGGALKLAMPFTSGAEPMLMPLMMNATEPVGVPDVVVCTLAAKATVWPWRADEGGETRASTTGAGLMVRVPGCTTC